MGTYDPDWDVQNIGAVNKEQREAREALNVTEQYVVRTTDLQTGEETISEPVWNESAAVDHAERLAAEFYGGDDVTWFDKVGGSYRVGRILEDGTYSEPLVRITVEEEEVDQEHVVDEEFD